ncbi:MAG: Protein TolB [bacterium]|nr:Protein TolB [bacterium]
MEKQVGFGLLALLAAAFPCSVSAAGQAPLDTLPWESGALIAPEEEPFFGRLQQFTFEGENAEAYWHTSGTRLIFQRTPQTPDAAEPFECDQIFSLDLLTGERTLISPGQGRTTCSFFIPGQDRVLFASTHAHNAACPAKPDYSMGYVWPIYPDYDIYTARPDGSDLQPLVASDNYDAEAVTDQTGTWMVYTALREGDLNLFVRNLRDGNEQQVTHRVGYDGGAVFSPDGTRIAWRASYPDTPEAVADYQRLLGEHLIRPNALDLYVANRDGSDVRRITNNGAANFGPIFSPDGNYLFFSSNLDSPRSREFELYLVEIATGEITQVTHSPEFDGFPMFSYCGRYLAFCSNRGGSHEGNTNVFVAEWIGPGNGRGEPPDNIIATP